MGKDDHFDIAIRRALVTDAKALGEVGPAAYARAYEYLWGDPTAVAAHLERFSVGAFAILPAQADIAMDGRTMRRGGRLPDASPAFALSDQSFRRRRTASDLSACTSSWPTVGKGSRHRRGSPCVAAGRHAPMARRDDRCAKVQEIYRSCGFTAIGASTFEHGVRPELAGMVIMRLPLRPSLTGSAEKAVQ